MNRVKFRVEMPDGTVCEILEVPGFLPIEAPTYWYQVGKPGAMVSVGSSSNYVEMLWDVVGFLRFIVGNSHRKQITAYRGKKALSKFEGKPVGGTGDLPQSGG
jgi:hypothetical protein